MSSAWFLVFGLAMVTFFTRAVFTMPERSLRLSPAFERMLRFAPAAALMAIVLPDIARFNGELNLSTANPRLIAGLVAFAIAATTRNILLTIVAGMLALTVLR